MYSRKELRDKLVQKGEDADTAAYCADWLAEHGFINDETYAAAIVRHYAAKNLGVSRIRMELSRRGISRELWEDALAEMPENDSALERYLRQHLPDPFDPCGGAQGERGALPPRLLLGRYPHGG